MIDLIGFIRDTLLDAGIPDCMCKLISKCISFASMSLLSNGGCTSSFCPTWGCS